MKRTRHLDTMDCLILKKIETPKKPLCSVQSPGECTYCVQRMLQDTFGLQRGGDKEGQCEGRGWCGRCRSRWRGMLSQVMREASQRGWPRAQPGWGVRVLQVQECPQAGRGTAWQVLGGVISMPGAGH